MAALAQPDLLETAIVDAIASVPMPKGVRFRRFYFDTDHAGSPALRVIFSSSTKELASKNRGKVLTDFVFALNAKLWGLPTERIPYISFEDAR